MLKLYNTLSSKTEVFVPIDEKNIRVYACGPTVYDRIHIGNARSVVIYDVLFRLLRFVYGEQYVKYVRNITDVDDKIINAAKNNQISEGELTNKMINYFHEDCQYLNCLKPTKEPRVTEEIPEIIAMIAKIIDNGFGYIVDGNVMFSVSKFNDYGKLSRRDLKHNIISKTNDTSYKEHNEDFLLWKKTNDGITWDSPWGNGRPGWHIECSAMSNKYLGESFDIHGGGVDLKFPHHENEIVQSKCANIGSEFARYWVHNGFLLVEGEKMSKSLGNFITVDNIKTTGLSGMVLRFALLSTDYKKPINYTEKLINDSTKSLVKFFKLYKKYYTPEATLERRVNAKAVEILSNDMNFSQYYSNLFNLYQNENIHELLFALELIGITLDHIAH